MKRTPEEQHLHEFVESYLTPLREEIKELRSKLKEIQKEHDATQQRVYDRTLDMVDDHIMTVEEWQNAVEDGYFENEDGSGYWVKNNLACRDEVFNSEPLDATHMVWYNK
jgi:hypothetical protein